MSREIVREHSLMMLLGIPTFMLLLYGYALNFDVRHVKLAIQDRSLSAASRDLVASFVNSTYFDDAGRLPGALDPGVNASFCARCAHVRPWAIVRQGAAHHTSMQR